MHATLKMGKNIYLLIMVKPNSESQRRVLIKNNFHLINLKLGVIYLPKKGLSTIYKITLLLSIIGYQKVLMHSIPKYHILN